MCVCVFLLCGCVCDYVSVSALPMCVFCACVAVCMFVF